LGGLLLLSVGASIWQIISLQSLGYIVSGFFAATLIRNMILVSIVPFAILGGGWILLTRKSVKNWFS
jgi:hypothetical protein